MLVILCIVLFNHPVVAQRVRADSIDRFDGARRIIMNELPFTGTLKPYLYMACYCSRTDTFYTLSVFIDAKVKTSLNKNDTLIIKTNNSRLKLGYSGIESQLKAQELFSFDVKLDRNDIATLLTQSVQSFRVITLHKSYNFNVVAPAQKYIVEMLHNLIRQSRSIAPKPFLNNGFL